jgi:hypothetical protein
MVSLKSVLSPSPEKKYNLSVIKTKEQRYNNTLTWALV